MKNEKVPLAKAVITDADVQAVVSVLKSGRLSMGPNLEAFEHDVAAAAGRRYGVGVASGTGGLHLCVRSVGLTDGDEVITTPFSFIATTNALLFERVKVIFVDIDPQSYNMDPDAVERAITPRTKAILPVEAFGNTQHFDKYEQIARRHGLKMIEDCCEALGARHNGRPAGNFGECGVFGFYPNKQVTAGEGGMIVTDNADIADLCRSLRNQGKDPKNKDNRGHLRLGFNYRLSELNAALGHVQMASLADALAKRRQAAELYNRMMANVEGIVLPPLSAMPPQDASWFVYVIRLADRYTPAQRDKLILGMRRAGIGCNAYFDPIHLQPYVRTACNTREGDFPITERIAGRIVALPFFAGITDEQVNLVKTELRNQLRLVD